VMVGVTIEELLDKFVRHFAKHTKKTLLFGVYMFYPVIYMFYIFSKNMHSSTK